MGEMYDADEADFAVRELQRSRDLEMADYYSTDLGYDGDEARLARRRWGNKERVPGTVEITGSVPGYKTIKDFFREKEQSMDSVEVRVRQELEERRVAQEVDKRLKLVESYGHDTFPEGAVVRFTKQFQEDGVAYTYAAIKSDGKWFTTGPKSPKGYTWDEFVTWLVSAGLPVFRLEKMVGAEE